MMKAASLCSTPASRGCSEAIDVVSPALSSDVSIQGPNKEVLHHSYNMVVDILNTVLLYLFWAGVAVLLYWYIKDRQLNNVAFVGAMLVADFPFIWRFQADFGPRRRR